MPYPSTISPQLLEEIFESSIICILTDNFIISHANKNFCTLLNYSEAELAGKSWLSLQHSEQSPPERNTSNGNNNKKTWHGELQLLDKYGNPIWLDCTIKPSETIKQKHYIVSCVEINQRIELIKSLKQRARQQGLIAILSQLSLNNIPIADLIEQSLTVVCGSLNIRTGIIFKLIDNASNVVVCNAYNSSSCIPGQTHIAVDQNNVLGYSINSHNPIHVDSLTDEQRFTIPNEILNEKANSATFLLIGDRKFPFGTLCLLSDTKLKLSADEINYLKTLCNMLAESINRQKIEMTLRSERELTKKYLDIAKVIILVLDKNGNILLTNQYSANTLGASKEHLIGLNFISNFIPQSAQDEMREKFSELLSNHQANGDFTNSLSNITAIINKQGQTRCIKWRTSPLHDEKGNITSLLSAGEDITEILEYEEEQKKLINQLHQAQKMEAIGMLAGGIAHDFNNILASILGFTELSLEELNQPDTKLHEYLSFIYDSGIKARDIIEQLQHINLQDDSSDSATLLPTLLKSTLKMLRSALPSSISIQVDIDPDAPAVHINAAKFNQLIMQILINARNAMNGKGNIGVSLKTIASSLINCSGCNSPINEKHVVLCITDDGPGICSESITLALQSIQGKSKSSGLAIISKLVHDANGHMVIESSSIDKNILEQGTSIKLFFKIADTGSEKTFTDKKTLDLSSIADKHVMIVDDENSVATFLGELLKVTGFRVSVFVDSTEALSTFQSSPDEFDLVITDQTMPILTGDLLASKMLEIRPTLPVILCTGHSDIMNLEKALALNIQGFQKKPIDTAELLGLVIQLLSKKSARS